MIGKSRKRTHPLGPVFAPLLAIGLVILPTLFAVAGGGTRFASNFVADQPNPSPANTGRCYLVSGLWVLSSDPLDFPGDVDSVRVTVGQPGDLGVIGASDAPITIDAAGTQGFPAELAVWDEQGTLLSPTGTGNPRPAPEIGRTLPAGVYYFAVSGPGYSAGDAFVLGAYALDAESTFSGTAGDTPYTGELGPLGTFDFFRFEIEASPCGAADSPSRSACSISPTLTRSSPRS